MITLVGAALTMGLMTDQPPPPSPPPADLGAPPPGWGSAAAGGGDRRRRAGGRHLRAGGRRLRAGVRRRGPGDRRKPDGTRGSCPSQVGSGRFRSMSVGEWLDATFTLYRRNFALIASISAVVQIPYALLTWLLFTITGVSTFVRSPFDIVRHADHTGAGAAAAQLIPRACWPSPSVWCWSVSWWSCRSARRRPRAR